MENSKKIKEILGVEKIIPVNERKKYRGGESNGGNRCGARHCGCSDGCLPNGGHHHDVDNDSFDNI